MIRSHALDSSDLCSRYFPRFSSAVTATLGSARDLNRDNEISRLCAGDGVSKAHHRGSLGLTALVHSLCSSGRFTEAHHRLILSLASGWIPDDRTCNALLCCLLAARSPDLTLRLLHHFLSANPAFVPSLPNYNKLIHQFCSLSRPNDARQVFVDMITRGRHPSVVTCTALVDGFSRVGELHVARNLFDAMRQRGIPPNSLTHSVLLRGLLRNTKTVDEGKIMIDELWAIMATEYDSPIKNAAFSNLVDALCHRGFFQEVFKLAEHPPPDSCVGREFAYAQMIDSLCRFNRHHGASRVVYLMKKAGFSPSLVSYNSIVHGLSTRGEGGCLRAYQLIHEGAHLGYFPPEPTYRLLIHTLCRTKHFLKARDLAISILSKDDADPTRTFNILLHGLSDAPSEQLNVLVLMLEKGLRPDVVSLNTVIQGFCKKGGVDQAVKIMGDMLRGEFTSPDVITFTTVVQGLLRVGRADEAVEIFRKTMPANSCNPNTATYNAILHGLCELRRVEEALEIFAEMGLNSAGPDARTHAIVVRGLLSAGRVEEARAFWEDVVWASGLHDGFVYAAVVGGLCALERLEEAQDFLYELVDCEVSPGIVSYNVLLDAACKRGSRREAYRIVSEMRRNGLSPDPVTWRILDKLHKRREGEPCERQGEKKEIHVSGLEAISEGEKVDEDLRVDGKNRSIAWLRRTHEWHP